MLNFTFKKVEEPKKPKYGLAIALTAIGVAVVETAAVVTLAVFKRISDKKRAAQNFDGDFEVATDDCQIDFEPVAETEDKISCEGEPEA